MTGPACLQCGLAAAQALSSVSNEINLGCRNADGALECQFNPQRRKAEMQMEPSNASSTLNDGKPKCRWSPRMPVQPSTTESQLWVPDPTAPYEGAVKWSDKIAMEIGDALIAGMRSVRKDDAWLDAKCALRDMWQEDECPCWPEVEKAVEAILNATPRLFTPSVVRDQIAAILNDELDIEHRPMGREEQAYIDLGNAVDRLAALATPPVRSAASSAEPVLDGEREAWRAALLAMTEYARAAVKLLIDASPNGLAPKNLDRFLDEAKKTASAAHDYAAPTTSPEPDAVREAAIEECAAYIDNVASFYPPDGGSKSLLVTVAKEIRTLAATSRHGGWEEIVAALKPFADLADAMYVSGHCGGASPEDWPDKWSISTTGGKDHHMPQAQGGVLTVADFRKLARLYHSLARNQGQGGGPKS